MGWADSGDKARSLYNTLGQELLSIGECREMGLGLVGTGGTGEVLGCCNGSIKSGLVSGKLQFCIQQERLKEINKINN